MKPLGGIEAGGTKFVCATGTGPDDVRAEARIPTTIPDETLARVIAFFREQATDTPLAALGLATFGPVDLDPRSPTFGFITSTPKPGWAHTDLAGSLGRALGLPVAVDTDVNGAALAEHRWGALRGCDPAVYVTVGTGVGGGAVVNGQTVHGAPSIPRWATSACPTTAHATRSRGCALIMAIAWKASPRRRRCAAVGTWAPTTCHPIIPDGNWRRAISRWVSPPWWPCSHPRGSCWVAG